MAKFFLMHKDRRVAVLEVAEKQPIYWMSRRFWLLSIIRSGAGRMYLGCVLGGKAGASLRAVKD